MAQPPKVINWITNQPLALDINLLGYIDVVKDFGADPTGNTDSTDAIQAAINSLPVTGGTVFFPVGNYLISSSINIGNGNGSTISTVNGIKLIGASSWQGLNGVTGEPVIGPVNFTSSVAGPAISVNGPINNWSIQNITISFTTTSTSARGISTQAASFGDIRNIMIQGCYGIGILHEITGSQPGSFNLWTNIQVFIPTAATTAQGIHIGSNTSNVDIFGDRWRNVQIIPNAGSQTAFYLGSADTCVFEGWNIDPANASIIFNYTENSQWPSSNVFMGVEWGSSNTVSNSGSPSSSARPNYIYGHSETNGVHNLNLLNIYPSLPTILCPGVSLTAQTASIGTTAIYTPWLGGMYRISAYLEITTVGNAVTVSVTIGWTDDTGATQNVTSPAISATAKNFATLEFPFRNLGGSQVSYLTTVSGAIGTGQYALYIKLEKLD